jgi:tape measure domain-containing protein
MTADIASLQIRIDSSAAVTATSDLDKMRDAGGRAEQGVKSLASAATLLKGALATAGVGATIAGLIQASDQYTKFTAQLKLATLSQREFNLAFDDVKRIAKAAQSDLSATGVLYARIANGTRELGIAQSGVAKITESVNLALKVSGASANEASSAMLQLSQAFGSGVLRGEEFNAVNEAAPRLMKALADGLGVPIGALKKMAEEGKLTSAVLADTLPKALGDLRKEASSIQTIGGAFLGLKNSVMEFVGTTAESSNAVRTINAGIGLLADNLGAVATAMTTVVAVKLSNSLATTATEAYKSVAANQALRASNLAVAESEVARATAAVAQGRQNVAALTEVRAETVARLAQARANIVSAQAAIEAARAAGAQSFALRTLTLATGELAAAETVRAAAVARLAVLGQQQASVSAKIAAASVAETAASVALTAARTGGVTAAGLAARAVGLLGGPVGAIITVLGLAATAWSVFGNAAKDAEVKAADAVEASHEEIMENIGKQIAKLKERNDLAARGLPVAKRDDPTSERRNQVVKDIDEAGRGTGKFENLSLEARTDILKKLGAQYGELTAKIEDFNRETGREADRKNAQSAGEWMSKYATNAEKLKVELDKVRKDLGGDIPAELEKRIRAQFADKDVAAKKETSTYATLTAAIKEKIEAAKIEASGGAALTESQKLQISLNEQIASSKLKLGAKDKAAYEALIKQLGAEEAIAKGRKTAEESATASAKIQADYAASLGQTVASSIKEAEANEELSRTYGLTKSAIADLNVKRMEERLEKLRGIDGSEDVVAALELEIAAKKRSALAIGKVETGESMKKAGEELDKFLDPTKAQTFGDALRGAFGKAGDSLAKLTSTLQAYGIKQAEVEKQRANAERLRAAGGSEVEYRERLAKLSKMDVQDRLAGYGDMTAAASGFFDEQSRGYKALQAASQVFHAAELAMTLAELIPKGISAVLNQGNGDPYSAFARMAAMAAIVTGLGVAIGGGARGSGGVSAADAQKAQGTGSVLGDPSAKSESISKALALIEKNTYQGLEYSAGMLMSLRAIEASMSGLSNIIARTSGLTDGTSINIKTGQLGAKGAATDGISKVMTEVTKGIFGPGLGDKIASAINNLWGKTTQSIVDSGISFGGALNDLQAGKGFNQFASVDTTKSSFFGLSKKTSNSVQTQGLNPELTNQFALIFTNLEETLKQAAIGMGVGADYVTNALDRLVLDVSTLSLKGLKGDELTAALSAVVSKAMDQISATAFPAFDQFQKVGEGLSETVIRVANDFIGIDTVFSSFGKTFGQLGLESIAARERLIEMSGGLEKFTSQGEYFLANFFSEAEQAAALRTRIQPTLSQFGLSTEGDGASKAFRDVVVALDTTSEAGARAYTSLMAIAPAFNTVIKAAQAEIDERKSLQGQIDELTLSSTQLLEKQRAALNENNRALFDNIQAIKSASDAIKSIVDAAGLLLGNVDTSFSEVQTAVNAEKEAEKKAHEIRIKAIQERIDKETAAVAKYRALSDAIKQTLDQMRLPGSEQRERESAVAQINAALAIAKAGGPLPAADALKGPLSVLTRDSSNLFKTMADFKRDFFKTKTSLQGLSDITDNQISIEQMTLNALNAEKAAIDRASGEEIDRLEKIILRAKEQVDELKGINTGVKTVAEAMADLAEAIRKARENPVVTATPGINDAYKQFLGRDPDPAGLAFFKDRAASGVSIEEIVNAIANSPEAKAQGLYRELLGREGDAAGIQFWTKMLSGTVSLDEARAAFMQSDEYRKLHPLSAGTNSVPKDRIALIHEGERVIPPADNRELIARLRNPDSSAKVLAAEVARLTVAYNDQQVALDTIKRTTKSSLDMMDRLSEGGNAMRVTSV